jgi:hypothetical protein
VGDFSVLSGFLLCVGGGAGAMGGGGCVCSFMFADFSIKHLMSFASLVDKIPFLLLNPSLIKFKLFFQLFNSPPPQTADTQSLLIGRCLLNFSVFYR